MINVRLTDEFDKKIVDFLKKTIHLNRPLRHFVWLYCGASADEAMG